MLFATFWMLSAFLSDNEGIDIFELFVLCGFKPEASTFGLWFERFQTHFGVSSEPTSTEKLWNLSQSVSKQCRKPRHKRKNLKPWPISAQRLVNHWQILPNTCRHCLFWSHSLWKWIFRHFNENVQFCWLDRWK